MSKALLDSNGYLQYRFSDATKQWVVGTDKGFINEDAQDIEYPPVTVKPRQGIVDRLKRIFE
jgi:hypothetical protein